MKRRDLESHLRLHECILLREGARHSVWHNPANSRQSTVPRHRNIDDPFLVQKICKDLGIPPPRKR